MIDVNTFYIVGGGPSLSGYNWDLLRSKRVIAINRAFEVLPWAEVVYFTDFKFFNEYKHKGLLEVDASLITIDDKVIHSRVINFINSGLNGLETDIGGLRHGKNSGYAAINLAVHFHAKRIILMGFDMGSEEVSVTDINSRQVKRITGRTHWHSGYRTSPNLSTYPTMLKHFPTLVGPLKELGIEVYNANPHSKLDVFPKVRLEEAHLLDTQYAGLPA